MNSENILMARRHLTWIGIPALIIIVACFFYAAGYYSSEASFERDFRQVEEGMTWIQVQSILGFPTENGTFHLPDMATWASWHFLGATFFITFDSDNKVVSYRRYEKPVLLKNLYKVVWIRFTR